MMRIGVIWGLATASMLGLAGGANAECDGDLLTVEEWGASIEKDDFLEYIRISIELQWMGNQSIRMLDASVRFEDVLGRDIASIGVERDIQIGPMEMISDGGVYSSTGLARLVDINPEDVVIETCVRGYVTADGEVVKVE